jgi:dihydrofolate reductase
MRKLIVFNHTSIDGFFADAQGGMRFAQNDNPDAEWDAFVARNARDGGLLVFGRITYELMAGFWPSPLASENLPVVAQQMNALRKIVFSRTLDKVSWNNTVLAKGDLIINIRNLKQETGENMVIIGSGSIVS